MSNAENKLDNHKAPDPTDLAVAVKIQNALIVKGITAQHLAEEAGMSYYSIRKSLKGKRALTFGEFGKIAKALGVAGPDLLPQELTDRSAAA